MRGARAVVAIACSLGVSAGVGAQVQTRDVDIKTPDGVVLKATYFSLGKPGPAVLLLHQCNMNRHAWDSLAADLVGVGMHVLALDYRGFGQSGGRLKPPPPPPAAPPGSNPLFMGTVSPTWEGNTDVELAYSYLVLQPGVDKARLAAGGASCGATFSADLALRHPEFKAILLMSGEASVDAVAHIAASPSLAVFGTASEGDAGVNLAGMREAVKLSKNPNSTFQSYSGTEHGVAMFPAHSDLRPTIVKWLQAQLR